jgi:RNA polymerase-interacting CarD/CdnL/TRCF family regulator
MAGNSHLNQAGADHGPIFQTGDPVVHPDYGAGRLVGIITQKVAGQERCYYSIELINSHGTLMIPVEQAAQAGLRLAFPNLDSVADVLAAPPQLLDDDYRVRQTRLEAKIHSGETQQVVEALRDLAWRERHQPLTERDGRLKSEAENLLAGELALRSGMTIESATGQLVHLLQQAVDTHHGSGSSQG